MRGWQGGLSEADRDSKRRRSVDPCTKCHSLGGLKGGWTSDWRAEVSQPPSGYAPATYNKDRAITSSEVSMKGRPLRNLKHQSVWRK